MDWYSKNVLVIQFVAHCFGCEVKVGKGGEGGFLSEGSLIEDLWYIVKVASNSLTVGSSLKALQPYSF